MVLSAIAAFFRTLVLVTALGIRFFYFDGETFFRRLRSRCSSIVPHHLRCFPYPRACAPLLYSDTCERCQSESTAEGTERRASEGSRISGGAETPRSLWRYEHGAGRGAVAAAAAPRGSGERHDKQWGCYGAKSGERDEEPASDPTFSQSNAAGTIGGMARAEWRGRHRRSSAPAPNGNPRFPQRPGRRRQRFWSTQ
jgi:hypothetical protein